MPIAPAIQEHSMKLKPNPFEAIRDGTKRFEMRSMDEKRKLVKPGDTIVFTNTEANERLTVSGACFYKLE